MLLEAAGDGEQGRLARAGGAHHRDEVALVDGKVDVLEREDGCLAFAVGLRHLAELQQTHWAGTILCRMHGTESDSNLQIILRMIHTYTEQSSAGGAYS